MTIDQRLERLTERHEALAQSIELLTHDVSELRAAAAITAATVADAAAAAAAAAAADAAAAATADAAAKERHEALRHTVELLLAEGGQTGEKIRHLALIAERNEVRAGHLELIAEQNEVRVGHLSLIAEQNEVRAGHLELIAERNEVRAGHLELIAERNEVRAGQMMETMDRLGRILEIHDAHIHGHTHRIERLEG